MDNINKENWSGWLVRPKPEWTNPGESPAVYVVLEDRGSRILLQMLPQYAPKNFSFGLPVEAGFKEWYDVIDKEIQNR